MKIILFLVQEEYSEMGQPVGVDLSSGEAFIPADLGVWDNYNVKRQLVHSWWVLVHLTAKQNR